MILRTKPARALFSLAAAALALALAAGNARAQTTTIYAVDDDDNLLVFDAANPGVIQSMVPITNISGPLMGIDFRPQTGDLYAVDDNSLLYTIDLETAEATQAGPEGLSTAIAGTEFGFDFNPVADAIRIVSNIGQNLRANPDTAQVTVDGDLAYASNDTNSSVDPQVVAAGYTNSNRLATTTELFVIDSATNALARVNPPNDGVMRTIGPLGVEVFIEYAAFDIVEDSDGDDLAYAALTSTGGTDSALYTINLQTGQATRIGQIGGGFQIRSMAADAGITEAAASFFNFSALSQTFDEENPLNDLNQNNVATITVLREGDLAGTASVDYSLANGTALAGLDYASASGRLTFASGQSSRTFQVTILADFEHEDVETVSLRLSNPSDNAGLGERADAVLVIRDNELAPRSVWFVDQTNTLHSFNAALPGVIESSVALTGLQSNETVRGIDFRASTGQMYLLGSQSNIYVVEPSQGLALRVQSFPFNPGLNGAEFGFDFNPVADAIRIVSDNEQDLRVNANTGARAFIDGTLDFPQGDPNGARNPQVVAAAYSNSFPGAGVTTLYDLDAGADALVRQDPPNNGTLRTIGSLGLDLPATNVGFDLTAKNHAFALFDRPGDDKPALYSVNLETGQMFLVGPLSVDVDVRAMAIQADVPFPSRRVFGIDQNNRLVSFDSRAPGLELTNRVVTGLQPGEIILGLDFRPSTGQLYALGNSGFVYTMNPDTGAAVRLGTTAISPALLGTEFGFDFNPVADAIRLVSDADQDLRINATTGAVAVVDGTLAYEVGDPNELADPNVVAAAYTNSEPAPATTRLYDIDSSLDILVRQNPPNNGVLQTVGPIGLDVLPTNAGLDILPLPEGTAFAAFSRNQGVGPGFYLINLDTGAAKLVSPIRANGSFRAMAVEFFPERTVYGVDIFNNLVRFKTTDPRTILGSTRLTGAAAGEAILGIDFRPATGQLYALGSLGNVYIVDRSTAAMTRLNASPLSPALNGAEFGFDFNPVADAIRVTSNADQDLRVNATTGAVAMVDGTLAFAAGDPNFGADPHVSGSAYANSTNGLPSPTTTTLYNIETGLDILVRQNPPNDGTLETVASLGVNVPNNNVGFDLLADGTGYATFAQPGAIRSSLWRVDVKTGYTRLVGEIGPDDGMNEPRLRGMAIMPREEGVVNISTRGETRSGNFIVIGGFIIDGDEAKTVLITGRGPSLTPFGVPSALGDPQLRLFNSAQQQIAFNDDWVDANNAAAIEASPNSPCPSEEAAILVTLEPGAYTAQLTGRAGPGFGSTGQALIEVWDEEFPELSRPGNISTRGPVGAGDFIMIGGFIVDGPAPQTVLVTGRGPSLTAFGVPDALENPTLRLFRGQTEIAFNDDWMDAANAADIAASPNGPTENVEAAIRMTLEPGFYTAHLAGKATATSDGTGQGLVEVWNETADPYNDGIDAARPMEVAYTVFIVR